ncbi:MAG TPA: hypothetical protein VMY88_00885 [Acidimicrobiales bacterium]|nr:hypothetical protein [Acidimicrobiales bacterium]
MRRFLTALGVAALASSLVLGGTPARAGELGWADAEGDAFPPVVSNPTLDIVKTSLTTTPESFVWKTQLKQLGDPLPIATGHHFTLNFTFGDAAFVMRVTQDRVAGDGIVFQKQDETTPTVQNLGCAKCKLSIDPATNTITLTASLGTMQAASRKLVAGAKIDTISVFTGLMWDIPQVGTLYGGSDQGDEAPPPDGATFTL